MSSLTRERLREAVEAVRVTAFDPKATVRISGLSTAKQRAVVGVSEMGDS